MGSLFVKLSDFYGISVEKTACFDDSRTFLSDIPENGSLKNELVGRDSHMKTCGAEGLLEVYCLCRILSSMPLRLLHHITENSGFR